MYVTYCSPKNGYYIIPKLILALLFMFSKAADLSHPSGGGQEAKLYQRLTNCRLLVVPSAAVQTYIDVRNKRSFNP